MALVPSQGAEIGNVGRTQDTAELHMGEAAGKPGISTALLCPQGCGMCCSWVLPGALELGWRLPEMWEKGDISPHLILIPTENV